MLKTRMMQTINIGGSFVFEVKSENLKAQVNLKTNKIDLHQISNRVNDLEIESLLVCVFSVAVLHVMLQPPAPKMAIVGTKAVSTINTDDYYLLSSVRSSDMCYTYNHTFVTHFDGCNDHSNAHDNHNCDNDTPDDVCETVGRPDDGTDGGGCGGWQNFYS